MTIVEQNMTLNAEIKASLRRSHESSFLKKIEPLHFIRVKRM